MASILKSHRVEYECNCGEWWPVTSLYYCRTCAILKCPTCAYLEIDLIVCPNCLENAPPAEARLNKNRCPKCHQCPNCEAILVTRAVGETCYLLCNTCRWSTKESDVQFQPGSTNWPMRENPLDAELNKVIDRMQDLAKMEKAQRDQSKSKRRSNVGSLLSDRYGLQAMYQKRKKTFDKQAIEVPPHKATDEVPELDPRLITGEVSALPLDVFLRQPLAVDEKPLRPVRMSLTPRRAVRCKGCDQFIAKLEHGPTSLKFKVGFYARSFVPEIRLSREPELSDDQPSVILLTVGNRSAAKCDVLLMPDNQDEYVECLTPLIELLLPPPDEAADLCDGPLPVTKEETGTGSVVFRRRHRAGIRMEANTSGKDNKVLGLVVKFRNELASKGAETEWHLFRIRIHLEETESV